jgi:hypothetical protein
MRKIREIIAAIVEFAGGAVLTSATQDRARRK